MANAEQPFLDFTGADVEDRPTPLDDWDDWDDDDWRGRGWDDPRWEGRGYYGPCVWVPPAVSMWVLPAAC